MAGMAAHLELAHRLPRPVAFVLGGGGSWGALQLGMLQALARTDIRPDLVVGTSVGSLNGALLAADPDTAVERLETLWPTVTRAAVFPGGVLRGLRTLSMSRAWIFDNEPLTDYLTATLPASTFEELALPFVAVATDFEAGTIAELDSGDLRSALLASSAIPGVYPWVERDGRRLVDGALVANIPMLVAVRRGAKSLVVLDCGLQGVDAGRASTLVEVLAQSSAIFARRQIAADLEHCAHLPTVWLSRGRLNTTNQLDFSMTAQLITEGFDQATATLQALGDVQALPAGLYGTPRELAQIPQIQPHVRHVQEVVPADATTASAPGPDALPAAGARPAPSPAPAPGALTAQ
jgi:NTE family protein